MIKWIPLKLLFLLILGPLNCVFAAGSAIEKSVALSHELELQLDCIPGSMIIDVFHGLEGDVCGPYKNLLYQSIMNVEEFAVICDIGFDIFYSTGVDDRVDAAREDARRFKNDCKAPATLEETISPADSSWGLHYGKLGCAQTKFKCSTPGIERPDYHYQFDEDCLRDTLKKAQQLRKQINPNPPIGAQCRDLSDAIDKELHEAYMAIDFTDRTVIDQSGQSETSFVQFDTSSAATQSYEDLCVEAEGKFRQIDFHAMCLAQVCDENGFCGLSSMSKNATLVVAAQPRCYSVECNPEDDEGLLREQTLRQTERRWEDEEFPDDDVRVRCFGYLAGQGEQEEFGACLEHSKAIGEDRLIKARNEVKDMQPVVQPAKNNFLFWELDAKEESTVTFPNAADHAVAFENACNSTGGNYSAVEDFTLRCEEQSTSTVRKSEVSVEQVWKYHVSGFFTCLSPLCYGESSSINKDGAENALLLKRISHLQKSKKSGSKWVCARSSGEVLAFSTTVLSLATLVTTWWFL